MKTSNLMQDKYIVITICIKPNIVIDRLFSLEEMLKSQNGERKAVSSESQ